MSATLASEVLLVRDCLMALGSQGDNVRLNGRVLVRGEWRDVSWIAFKAAAVVNTLASTRQVISEMREVLEMTAPQRPGGQHVGPRPHQSPSVHRFAQEYLPRWIGDMEAILEGGDVNGSDTLKTLDCGCQTTNGRRCPIHGQP